eukprot:1794291-Ditylum_brightwellii.AAC.1
MEQFRKAQKIKLTLKSPFNSGIHGVPSVIEALVKAPFFITPQGLCPKMVLSGANRLTATSS